MELFKKTIEIMKKNNIVAKKNLGQNFLINEEVVNKIIESAEISSEDLIIEIGPGLGVLTEQLLEKAQKVICVELDNTMINILKNRLNIYTNLEIINKDILKINLKELINNEKQNNSIKRVKVVANLPYYITTPIVMKLLEEELNIDSITVMVQKEVAERLIAKPGTSLAGSITYTVYYYSNVEKVIDVPKESFIPTPEVTSSVIKFQILDKPRIKTNNKELLFKTIKLAFGQRRKTLLNALINGKLIEDKEKLKQILIELGIDVNIRGEKLTLEQFAQFTEKI